MHIESVFSQLYLPNNSLKRYFIFQEAIITKVIVHHTVTAILTALTGFPNLTGFLNEFESLIVN